MLGGRGYFLPTDIGLKSEYTKTLLTDPVADCGSAFRGQLITPAAKHAISNKQRDRALSRVLPAFFLR